MLADLVLESCSAHETIRLIPKLLRTIRFDDSAASKSAWLLVEIVPGSMLHAWDMRVHPMRSMFTLSSLILTATKDHSGLSISLIKA